MITKRASLMIHELKNEGLSTITSDLDLNSTPTISQQMTGLVQNGRAFTLQGHGHMMNLTAPDEVNATLLDWLNTGEGDRS